MTAIGSCRASPRNQAKTIHDSSEILRPEYCRCQNFLPCLCQLDLFPMGVCSMERDSRLDGSKHFLPRAQKLSVPRPKRRNDFQGEVKGAWMKIQINRTAEVHTWRWAARLARKARWTSRARFGGRLSFLLRPLLEDMERRLSKRCGGKANSWQCRHIKDTSDCAHRQIFIGSSRTINGNYDRSQGLATWNPEHGHEPFVF